MRRRRLLIAAAVLVVAALAWGIPRWQFRRTHEATDNAQVDGRVMPVLSRVSGYVLRIAVVDNQHVRAGDTLAIIDPRDILTRLHRARAAEAFAASDAQTTAGAAVHEAASQAGAAATRIDAARAAHTRAASEYERTRSLAAAQIAPPAQLDDARATLQAADAAVRGAEQTEQAMRASVTKLRGQAEGATAKLAAARADVADAELQLSYTVILAPTAGRVAKRAIERGQLVAPGQAMMALVQDDSIWVTANFKETQLGRLFVGAPVTFTVDAYGDHEFRGHVRSVQPATGARFALLPPDNATGNFTKVVQRVPVEIGVDPASIGSYALYPGLSAVVAVDVRRDSVPQRAHATAGRDGTGS